MSILAGFVTVVIGLVLNGLAWTPRMFFVSTVIWAFGFQLCGPVVPILISRLAPPSSIGKAMGLYNSFGNASRVLGPTALSPLYNLFRPGVFYFLGVCMTV